MKIVKCVNGKNFELATKEVSTSALASIGNLVSQNLLQLLHQKYMYPKQIAQKLRVHEQNVYYHIRKLEQVGIIEVKYKKEVNGTSASFYGPSSNSFFYSLGSFHETSKPQMSCPKYLQPFITNGSLDALIVVGSPDPHGPLKARSKDGYFGMDLALFLGTYINVIPESKVKLDTEITQEEIASNNIILLGGPIVNKVSGILGKQMSIYFDEEKKGIYSTITKKTYFSEECGFILQEKNPFNENKQILQLAGLRNAGTKATILAFLKHFETLQKGNFFSDSLGNVVEGIDFDSDGVVDDCEFLE